MERDGTGRVKDWGLCQGNFLLLLHFYSTHLVCYTFINTVIDISPLKQTKILHKDKRQHAVQTGFLLNPLSRMARYSHGLHVHLDWTGC